MALAESSGIIVSGYLTRLFGIKKAMIVSFAISLVGGVLILSLGGLSKVLMALFVGVAQVGISAGFNLVYLINSDVFPTLFTATAMGFCNFVARVLTTTSPLIAEMPGPIPMIIYCGFCVGGLLLTNRLEILNN